MTRPRHFLILKEAPATLLLAVPIIVGQLSQMLMGVTDSVMIGRTGTVPLAASAFGGGVFNTFFLVGVGFLTPVAVFTAQRRGAGKAHEAGEYLRHGLVLAFTAGGAEALLILLLSWRLKWFGQSAEVLAAVNPFFKLIGLSVVPSLAYIVLRQFAEAMGRPWVPMLIMLGGVVLNAFLNWVFIYGHLGAPQWGLTGAGISTLASRTLGVIVLFAWLREDPVVRAAWPSLWFAPLSRRHLTEMSLVGLPVAGCLLFESGAFGFSAVMMGWLGAVPLAAHQIALSCAAMTFMFALGLSMAVGMRMSAAVGAGERQRLRPIWLGGLAMGVALATAFTLVFLLFGRPIAACFVKDPAVVSLATFLLVVAAVFQIVDGAQVINTGALRGLPDVRVPALITFVAYWGLALPAGYLIGVRGGLGAGGIWGALAAGLAFAAVFLGWRFASLTRGADADK